MTDSSPIFDRRAVFVIDVQKYLIAGPDAVPDALQVRQAIGGILESIRRHNDNNASMKTKIAFVQHDDKDPHDPLHNGKPTWELEFNPRVNDDTEVLVSKDVRNVFESNPRLAQDLHLQGITQISAMGVQSDCCVRSSILGAIACGFDAQDITLLQGTHSTFDDASTGKSYSQIKKDVEEELAALGVQIKKWQRSKITDVWQGNENKRPCM